MIRDALLVPLVYVVGGVGLSVLAWFRLTSDDPERDIALWIVLPIAWWVSFLPMATTLLAALRIRGVFTKLEELHEQIQRGEVCEQSLEDQVEYWTEWVARENRVPKFLVRRFVRRVVAHLVLQAAQEAHGNSGACGASGEAREEVTSN